MYKMDISIFGYKVNLEIFILIGVIYLILVSHTICGCCNMFKIMEGLETMTGTDDKEKKDKVATNGNGEETLHYPQSDSNVKEGFVGANTNYGQSSSYSVTSYTPVDTKSWFTPSLVVEPGKPLPEGVKQILDREPQPVPLPEGEMLLFANTPFKPECCPNTYSNSMGCSCMTTEQYNFLIQRGFNNVPYSEY
jgi:hypothetical protein